MTFSEKYLTHLRVLENVGMTSIEPVEVQGKQIQPIEFLRAVLPDLATLGPRTKGQTVSVATYGEQRMESPNASSSTTPATTKNATAKFPVRRLAIPPESRQ